MQLAAIKLPRHCHAQGFSGLSMTSSSPSVGGAVQQQPSLGTAGCLSDEGKDIKNNNFDKAVKGKNKPVCNMTFPSPLRQDHAL